MENILNFIIKNKLTHISSIITTYPILQNIFENKNKEDKVVLSNGHSGVALYHILEREYGHSAQQMLDEFGIHPHRDINRHIHVSSGSLGCAITVATGMALGNPDVTVHCLISDGESFEGSVWESLMFINNHKIKNIKIYVNINGLSAYDEVDVEYLINRLYAFLPSIIIYKTKVPSLESIQGIHGHYHNITHKDKEMILNKLNEETICELVIR